MPTTVESRETREQWMRHALRLAVRGRGFVEPNPMVGAVLVHDGRIVAAGWHRRFGQPHAEVEALRDAARRNIDPKTCAMYVTLEPCAHQGKTPPCVDAIVAAGVPRVVVAMTDPFPLVGGRGLMLLREAGVEVETDVCRDDAAAINAPFVKRVTTGLPWVIAKWAQTIDGRIATAAGQSKWISNEASRRIVHRLRARVDAIIVGVGTVIADDPMLTARDVRLRRTARRVVVDPTFRMPRDCRLLNTLDVAPLTIAVHQSRLEQADTEIADWQQSGVEFVPLPPAPDGRLLLDPLFRHLVTAHRTTNVLVEGGASLMGSVLGEGLVDEMRVFVGPRLMGDPNALGAVTGCTPATVQEAPAWRLQQFRRVGDDVMLRYTAANAGEAGEGAGKTDGL